MGERRLIRENVVQYLFQSEMNVQPNFSESELHLFFKTFEVGSSLHRSIKEYLVDILDNLNKIDEEIVKQSKNWKLDRMSRVDRAVLRVAFYELLFKQDIPAIVIINEAVEIGKNFGSADSSSFINGILDKASRRIRADL